MNTSTFNTILTIAAEMMEAGKAGLLEEMNALARKVMSETEKNIEALKHHEIAWLSNRCFECVNYYAK